MIIEGLQWLGVVFLAYIGIGYAFGWIWLFEARIKCIDKKNKVWEEYLNSLSGIFSFQMLCTLFWFPVLFSRLFKKAKRRRLRSLKVMFQKTFEIWDVLSESNQNKKQGKKVN